MIFDAENELCGLFREPMKQLWYNKPANRTQLLLICKVKLYQCVFSVDKMNSPIFLQGNVISSFQDFCTAQALFRISTDHFLQYKQFQWITRGPLANKKFKNGSQFLANTRGQKKTTSSKTAKESWFVLPTALSCLSKGLLRLESRDLITSRIGRFEAKRQNSFVFLRIWLFAYFRSKKTKSRKSKSQKSISANTLKK